MLYVLLMHNFDFTKTKLCNIIAITSKLNNIISLDIFKWIIINNLINPFDNYSELYQLLLREVDQVSFDKFKYAFETDFPISIEYHIIISNINVVEQLYQYANNSRNIDFKYTIGLKSSFNNRTLDFLRDYIEWIKLYEIEDNLISSLWNGIAKKFGIVGLQLIKENRYLRPKYTCICRF
jgi:hypothetical protein